MPSFGPQGWPGGGPLGEQNADPFSAVVIEASLNQGHDRHSAQNSAQHGVLPSVLRFLVWSILVLTFLVLPFLP